MPPNPDALPRAAAAIQPMPLAWAIVPFAAYLAVLASLWSNAPTWDDYGTVLENVVRMIDAPSAREWRAALVAQHNEHRIYTVRVAARAAALLGAIDFRVLILMGNLAFAGVLALICAEFRATLEGPVVLAAAFVMFQWSYFEAALWTSGGLTNMGAIFFSFAALFFALRGGRASVAGAIALATLGTGCSASGLFALPLAAGVAALQRRATRAAVLGAAALVLWLLYFRGYVRPPNHPSPLTAFEQPIATAKLFLVILGSIVPGRDAAMAAGGVIAVALGALTWKGAWRAHPIAAAWIAFILVSAAAAAAGRVGFGVWYASRYAIYSTCLVVLCLLGWHGLTRPWSRRALAFAVLAGASISFAVSAMAWRDVRAFALNGRLLAKPVPAATDMTLPAYFGMYFPNPEWGIGALRSAERHGLYVAPSRVVHPAGVRTIAAPPPEARLAGYVDEVVLKGRQVVVEGWTDIPATVPGRVFDVVTSEDTPSAARVDVTDRSNAARVVGDPRLTFSGFRLALEYPSAESAARIAASLCVVVEAPGRGPDLLSRASASCGLPARRG
jgi:hypothetical protein